MKKARLESQKFCTAGTRPARLDPRLDPVGRTRTDMAAGGDRFSVQEDGAGSAQAYAAGSTWAGESDLFTKDVDEHG